LIKLEHVVRKDFFLTSWLEQESAFSAEEKQIAGEAGETREPNKKPNVNTINLRQ